MSTTAPRAAPRREELKLYHSSLENRSISNSPLMQPSFYMGVANMLLMIFTQRFPEEFLTPKYLTMSYNGVKASSTLAIPFCVISGAYLAVASALCTAPSPLTGHFWGCVLSVTLGAGMISLRRISWYYPLLGCTYLTFGGFHHYRRLMMYGDNAPLFYVSDFADIWCSYRATRKRGRRNSPQTEKAALDYRDIK